MYKEIFDKVPVGLSLTRIDGTLVRINDAFTQMLGYTIEAMQGKSIWDIFPHHLRQSEQTKLDALIQGASYPPQTIEVPHALGYNITIRLSRTTIKDPNSEMLIVSSIEDISQSEKTARVLNKAQELGNIGHWYLDFVGNELNWSDETYRIFGLQPQEFAATYEAFVERIFPDDREAVNSAYSNSVTLDEPYQIEHRVIRPDGTIRYVVERCEHLHGKDGAIIGSIGTVLDITDRKVYEQELQEAKARSDAANRSKSAFIANMSHELRTPLNAILGFSSQLLEATNLTEGQRKHIATVNQSGNHLLAMINDILEYSKNESGTTTIHRTTFNLQELVTSVSDMFLIIAHKKGISCTLHMTPDVPLFIESDARKLKQILLNIISNAIKFTDHGGIALEVTTHTKDQTIQFAVSDTGCGVGSEMIEAIFEPFVQNDGIKKVEGGTGLGLAISREFARMLGGDLTAQSTLKEGSTFRLSLPLVTHTQETIDIPIDRDTQLNPEQPPLHVIPQAVQARIIQACNLGSKREVKTILDEIQSSYPSQAALLVKHVERFDFEGILRLLLESHV